jgi:hypothetical protein
MIEYDVRIQFKNLSDLFSSFRTLERVDFIALLLGRRFREWARLGPKAVEA